jgi:hypothetical protein
LPENIIVVILPSMSMVMRRHHHHRRYRRHQCRWLIVAAVLVGHQAFTTSGVLSTLHLSDNTSIGASSLTITKGYGTTSAQLFIGV